MSEATQCISYHVSSARALSQSCVEKTSLKKVLISIQQQRHTPLFNT